jgi:hypothetical protein
VKGEGRILAVDMGVLRAEIRPFFIPKNKKNIFF